MFSDPLPEYCAFEGRLLDAMSPELSEEEFNEIALEVHDFQRRWNRPYNAFAATKAPPRTWREIPAVPQSAFKRVTLTCVPLEHVGRTFRTSGTTGERRGEHHFFDTALYEASIVRGWSELQLSPLRLVIMAAHPGDALYSSLSHMFGTLALASHTITTWCCDCAGRLDPDRARKALGSAESDRVILLGTALAYLHLFECLEPGAFHLEGSFALETGGYKGSGRDIPKADLYGQFATHLGIPPENVINEYGMTELSSQFYARGLGGIHAGPPWIRAVVIDPETGGEVALGHSGVLRIFDLANLNSSLAIETQDLAIRREHGFELLGRDPRALPRGCSRAADEQMQR
jgi:hypothetical protein